MRLQIYAIVLVIMTQLFIQLTLPSKAKIELLERRVLTLEKIVEVLEKIVEGRLGQPSTIDMEE